MKGGGATKSTPLIESATCSVIIGIGPRPLVVEEVGRIERRRNRVEGERRLREVETIRQIIGRSVRIAERRQVERRLCVSLAFCGSRQSGIYYKYILC